MDLILTSVLILGSIALVSGLLVAIASKIFYVEPDTRVQEIYELLPHFNCGACGTPGCEAMAEELVSGTIVAEKCRPAKPEQIQALNTKLVEFGIKKTK